LQCLPVCFCFYTNYFTCDFTIITDEIGNKGFLVFFQELGITLSC
jgi:hypothetical protein